MNETDFFGMIVWEWLLENPHLSVEDAIDELDFDDEQMYFVEKWYEQMFPQERSGYLH